MSARFGEVLAAHERDDPADGVVERLVRDAVAGILRALAELELREPTAFDASGKYLRVNQIRADAAVNTAALTQYRITGAFAERREEPFVVRGKIDAIAGYAMHRATALRPTPQRCHATT